MHGDGRGWQTREQVEVKEVRERERERRGGEMEGWREGRREAWRV